MQLSLGGLGLRFPASPWLFRGLDAVLRPGHTYAVTGPSGAGKSSLLNLLAGWIAPTEGSVRPEGIGKVNWVFQSPYGMARRSAMDHVVLPGLVSGLDRTRAQTRALELLDRFGLDHLAERQFRSLSGGEAQRLMLARAVAADPQLLLVDEPTAQLDVITARKVNEAIRGLASAGRIVVVATHDQATRVSCTDHLDLVEYIPHDRPGSSSV